MLRKPMLRRWSAVWPVVSALGTAPVPTNANEISGVVLEEGGAAPIAGAIVSLQASTLQTTTAADGSFSLYIAGGTDLVIVAAAKGYYNKAILATPPVTGIVLGLPRVSEQDNPGYVLESPDDCGLCHPNQAMEWFGSPMANAGTNTWVHDIYNGTGTPGGMGGFVYTRDSVFAGTNPNSECASCHQPESWLANPFSRIEGPPDPGYPSAPAMHGVSCDVCHKVADVDVAKINFPGLFPGAMTYRRPPSGQQVMYGLLGDVDFSATGLMQASYQPQLAAEVCGLCHQDKNDLAEDHSYTGIVSEPTYIEWLNSAYSDPLSPIFADCVTCHMPPSGEVTVCAILSPPLLRDPATIRSHRIEGTTPFYLENAVELSMQSQIVGNTLDVEVTVQNSGTGHHVPTGVTVRNMILLVQAWRDGEDPLLDAFQHTGPQAIHDLGGIGDPAQGYYAGLAGKLYAKVNHDAGGNGPTFFTDATGILFDNRIAALDSDTTTYTFEVPPGDDTLHVRARLIYRRAFRFLVDAKQWTEDGHGNPLEDLMAPDFGHLMESVEHSLPYAVPCPPTSDGDVSGDGAVDSRDLAPFLNVLFNSPSGPVEPAFCAADLSGDGAVTEADADLLVALLLGI